MSTRNRALNTAELAGASYAEAARFANAVGALSVQKLGAVNGVRTLKETEEWMRTARSAT